MELLRKRWLERGAHAQRVSPGPCVIGVDAAGCVRGWTKAAEAVFGHCHERAMGLRIEQLAPFVAERAGEHEGWCRRVDGSVFRGMVGVLAADDAGPAANGVVQSLVVTDVTARYVHDQAQVRAQAEALQLSEAKLVALERQVLEVSEQLQRQIGQDLHDGLGQLLTGTAFLTKGLQHSLGVELQPQAQRIVELINQAIARVRSLARGLSPIHADAQSLLDVLRHAVSEASELLGVTCELTQRDFSDSAQPTVIAQLCLITREAITNAVRHGQADHIVVHLSRQGDHSVLSIDDNGTGIGELVEGLGVRSMRYRAKIIGGNLTVARTHTGTTVRCLWPDS